MKHLDLFSGIGGFALAARWAGFETIGFCEIEPYCQKLLKQHWPNVPCYNDIRKLDGKQIGAVDIITGGYPCQPFSVAGRQKGKEDARHLWPEVRRIIKQIRPKWIICENVEGHIRLGLDTVLNDLENENYTCWTFVIPACSLAAPHQRYRLFIVAYSNDYGFSTPKIGNSITSGKNDNEKRKNIASKLAGCTLQPAELDNSYAYSKGLEGSQRRPKNGLFTVDHFSSFYTDKQDQLPKPTICRGDDGFSQRVDRLKGLGNAIVPQIAYLIMETIKQYEATPKE